MKAPWRRRARGSAVVELALVVLFLVPVAACLVLLGRLQHRASGLERAGYEAARYLASVPRAQMSTDAGFQLASATARAIADASLAAAGQPPLEQDGFDVDCSISCGDSVLPQMITVELDVDVAMDGWDLLSRSLLSQQSRELHVTVTMRYEN
ncbi:pilus assembly protein [Pseudoduganella sp. LjRoot289]|uniref:TadE/TadG family type IV pilus assembly protein n=1 Tax=Pseudoduganella sp. LjRoot289 TaxID=3342314 RepID=UPI003ED08B7C